MTEILNAEDEKNIKALFNLLGPDCRQLLTYIIYENMSMKEVLEKMHYENEQVIRNKKYMCLAQLKEILSTKPKLISLLKTSYYG